MAALVGGAVGAGAGSCWGRLGSHEISGGPLGPEGTLSGFHRILVSPGCPELARGSRFPG